MDAGDVSCVEWGTGPLRKAYQIDLLEGDA
jgi:hypothetical protein